MQPPVLETPPPVPPRPASEIAPLLRWLLRAWLAASGLACAWFAAVHMRIGLNSDHLDLLDQVVRLLAGGEPYVAYSDINPPLIHLIYIFPVLLMQATGMKLYASVYLLVYALTALSLYCCYKILRYSKAGPGLAGMVVSTLALMLLGISFIHQTFADREHLMLTLIAPWLVLNSPLARYGAIPRQWRTCTAIMGAIGFAIKPYFLIFYAATFAYRALFVRPVQEILHEWEHHIVWVVGVLYVTVTVVFFREYLTAILPLAWYTYGTSSWSPDLKFNEMWRLMVQGNWPVWAASAVAILFTRRFFDPLLTYLLFLVAAAIGSYQLNGGWWYTQYPFLALDFALAVALAVKLLLYCQRIQPLPAQLAAIAATLASAFCFLHYWYAVPVKTRIDMDTAWMQQHGVPSSSGWVQPDVFKTLNTYLDAHPRFFFITTSLRAQRLRPEGSHRESLSRYDYLWPLAGIVKMGADQNPAERETYLWAKQYFLNSMAEDLMHNKPDLVIVDTSPRKFTLPENYKMLPLLKENQDFEDAWKHYRLAESIDKCEPKNPSHCAFEIYLREPEKKK